MTQPGMAPPPGGMTPSVDAGRLWAGGAAAAAVAALVAVLGILIAQDLVGVTVMAPHGHPANIAAYAVVAAVIAFGATGLLHILLLTTPSATRFFGWIMVLATLIAVVLPLSLLQNSHDGIATAALNLVIGLVITLLLESVAHNVLRRRRHSPGMGEPRREPYA